MIWYNIDRTGNEKILTENFLEHNTAMENKALIIQHWSQNPRKSLIRSLYSWIELQLERATMLWWSSSVSISTAREKSFSRQGHHVHLGLVSTPMNPLVH
jgi:hypothetical protein